MARARKRINADRLNTPGPRRRSLFPSIKLNSEVFGSFAETFARFMGTAGFLFGMSVFIVAWIVINNLVPTWFKDPFPYMLMTLMLSVQASYAAPLILLAQNRQEARDRIMVEDDRRTAAQSRADMDFLAREIASLRMRLGEVATRDFVRAELRDLLEELDHRADVEEQRILQEALERDAAREGTTPAP
ncbi:MAG TPA: DUF1003 domain-containing protein [Propionibacteriaceae bacterium]|nr:DUF1003 domain-containing protein [Propionibacteriaceae bacterium]